MEASAPPLRFKHWLHLTKQVQTDIYGYDFDALQVDVKGQAEYIWWNVFAAQQELAELSVEFSWKPWAVDKPFVNRQRIMDEAVDVLHFMGNMLTAIGVTDDELNEAYRRKVQLNIQRKQSGSYSAKKGTLADGSDLG